VVKQSTKVPKKRGFAALDEETRRAIARKGGLAAPAEKRPTFKKGEDRTREAGRKGGQAVPPEKRSFSQSKDLAATAGSKGGTNKAVNATNRKTAV
jgi:general stress protein YciG